WWSAIGFCCCRRIRAAYVQSSTVTNSVWIVRGASSFRRQPAEFTAFYSRSCLPSKQIPRLPSIFMNQPSLRIEPPYRPEFEYPLSALAPAAQAESLREPLSLTH